MPFARIVLSAIVFLGSFFLPWYLMQIHFLSTANTPAETFPAFTYTNAPSDILFVTSPKPGESVTSTIILTGYARGPWFFEAVFPIEVKNKDGITLGEGQAKTDSEWTTDKLVPFTAEIDLKSAYNGPATIILKKDNPSGDPARDASVSFPVVIE